MYVDTLTWEPLLDEGLMTGNQKVRPALDDSWQWEGARERGRREGEKERGDLDCCSRVLATKDDSFVTTLY